MVQLFHTQLFLLVVIWHLFHLVQQRPCMPAVPEVASQCAGVAEHHVSCPLGGTFLCWSSGMSVRGPGAQLLRLHSIVAVK